MARRRELKGIAGGVLSSFNSRNNDINGYWGIGMLSLLAKNQNANMVVIDLLYLNMSPPSEQFATSLAFYKDMLNRHLLCRKIPASWVKSASISIGFNLPFEEGLHSFRSTIGKPYIATLAITDGLCKTHFVKTGGNCWPNDPTRESRSGRANNV